VSDGCTNTTAAIGMAQIFLAAQDGVVSLSTASYYVDEAAPSTVVPTPEPGTLLMVGTGIFGIATFSRLAKGCLPRDAAAACAENSAAV
jgi:hypothetical protein